MAVLKDLYQEIILDHNRNPRNFRAMEQPTRKVDGYNPLCGDHYSVYVRIENGVIADVSFQGAGCAISKASASVMSQTIRGKTVEEAMGLFDTFHRLVKGEIDPGDETGDLGRLAAFSGVSEFPARVKCAVLAWHTLKAALTPGEDVVTTE